MKVLVVDDNEALRAAVKDALSVDGHNVREAGTAEEAAEKVVEFKPDVMVLDSVLGGEEGLHVLSLLRDLDPQPDFGIVLVTAMGEKVPGDDQRIRLSVEKPFKAAQISEAVRGIQSSAAEEAAEEAAEKATRRSSRSSTGRRFGRRERVQEPDHGLAEHGVRHGKSYVVFEQRPEAIHDFVGWFDPAVYDIMVVTTDKAKAIKEMFSYADIEVLPLTGSGRAGTLAVRDMGTLTARIRQFVDERDRPVVVFDTFGEVMRANGNNLPLLMLEQLRSGVRKRCTFAVSLDAKPLSEKDRRIFLSRMEELHQE